MSDEILTRPERFERAREVVSNLLDALDARTVFLVDENGAPFGAVGHVEFTYPHPLSTLSGEAKGTPVLEALVGQSSLDEDSPVLVERAGRRALLVVIFERPPIGRRRRDARDTVRCAVAQLLPLLEDDP